MSKNQNDNGLQLRQAINSALRGDMKVKFVNLMDGSIKANIDRSFGSPNYYSAMYSVVFKIDEVQYHKGGVMNFGCSIPVDMRTLQWAHRTLQELQVMVKLGS